jgi:hypothetical protein
VGSVPASQKRVSCHVTRTASVQGPGGSRFVCSELTVYRLTAADMRYSVAGPVVKVGSAYRENDTLE